MEESVKNSEESKPQVDREALNKSIADKKILVEQSVTVNKETK